MSDHTYEFIWALIGAFGSAAKYCSDLLVLNRQFKPTELILTMFSSSFISWLCAKAAVVVAGLSIDVAFIVAGMSGVIGFRASVAMLDSFFKNLRKPKDE